MRSVALLLLLVAVANAERYKLCATSAISDETCYALKRGSSSVSCLRVIDQAECAIRLSTGEADFGVFEAEDLLLSYKFYPNDIMPIFQLKHRDREQEEFQFQSVAVVPTNVTSAGQTVDFTSMKNGGLCHPGFSDSQWWNDYVLKYFERRVAAAECQSDLTVAENEVQNIKNFFGQACRPGEWATDSTFDATLKEKYPELCALCDNPASCTYKNQDNHGHTGALDCLTSGRGQVAYIALTYVRQYFNENETSYQFLCMDGTTQPLSTTTPCAWIKQPWGVIAARKPIAKELTDSLRIWLGGTYSSEEWITSLNKVLQEDSVAIALPENTSTVSYISKGREVDLPNSQTCKAKPIRWCTIGDLETNKCNWVARGTEALGIEPKISCEKSNSTFQCFRDIASDKADVITIDSNYGHLARTVYGLGTVLYSETDNDRNSMVIAVTREDSKNPIKSFSDLSGRKACFPEYGGIAWLSFVKIARTNEIISSTSCDYLELVGKLFSGACTPGIHDNDHSAGTLEERNEENSSNLCSSCPRGNGTFCAASKDNAYYGDEGALNCLDKGDGDIAFLEVKNLNDTTIDSKKYRVLCKNGTLAAYPKLRVDEFCAWSVTIDSEIVGRRNSSELDVLDTALALLKMENWLGYRVHAHRPIRIYDKFNGTADLLFKDSTSGLANTTSTLHAVVAYKDLFRHVETCSAAPLSVAANLGLIALVVFSTTLFGRVL